MGIARETTEVVSQPPRGLSLRRNFAWTVLGNVTYAACQWGMLVALSKVGSPTMLGQFALGLAIGAPVMMLANLQLRAVQATDARNEYRFGEYLGLRLLATAVAFAAICLIAWLAGYRWQTALVVILVGIAKSVESVSDVIYGLMQKCERLDRIAIAMMLRGLGSVMVFALALWLTRSVAWAVTALAAWWSAVLLSYERKTGSELLKAFGSADDPFAPAWQWNRMRQLAWLSLPLGVVMVLISLNTNIPRYFVEHYLGEAALGYFAALAYVMFAGNAVVNALGQSALPRLANDAAGEKRREFVVLLLRLLGIGAALGAATLAVGWVAGPEILSLLYRPEYGAHQDAFLWLLAAAAASYFGSFLGVALTAMRRFQIQMAMHMVTCVVAVAAASLLVTQYGLAGAGMAVTATATFATAVYAVVLAFHLRPGVALLQKGPAA